MAAKSPEMLKAKAEMKLAKFKAKAEKKKMKLEAKLTRGAEKVKAKKGFWAKAKEHHQARMAKEQDATDARNKFNTENPLQVSLSKLVDNYSKKKFNAKEDSGRFGSGFGSDFKRHKFSWER